MDKKYIQVFSGKQSDSSCGSTSGGCGCGCGCGPSTTSISFDDLQMKYLTALNSIAHFDVYKLSDQQDSDELISKLNEVLSKSGEKLVVDKSNLEFVLSQSAPIIAVDGRIISIKNYPDEKQLYDAVLSGKKIPVKKGCC
jgi:hypothetical protein